MANSRITLLIVGMIWSSGMINPATAFDEFLLPAADVEAYAPPPSAPLPLHVAQQSTEQKQGVGEIFSSGPIEAQPPANSEGIPLPPVDETAPAAALPKKPPTADDRTIIPPTSVQRSRPIPLSGNTPKAQPRSSEIKQKLTVPNAIVHTDKVYEPNWNSCTCCGDRTQRWFSFESLMWWTSGSHLPAIASTSPTGTPPNQAGVLSPTGNAQVLYGNGDIFDFSQAGFRLRGGRWFDDRCDGSGVIAEFFMLAPRSQNWYAASDGDPILARPFYNADPVVAQQDSQIIAYPGMASGTQAMTANTNMYSAAIHLWSELEVYIGEDGCGEDRQRRIIGRNCGSDKEWLLGLKIGPRFAHLNDTVNISESLTSATSGNQFQLRDYFDTQNSFLGGEIGLRARRRRGRFNVDLGLQLAIGGTHQELAIRGSNTVTTASGSTTDIGGFFAQPSNIGKYDKSSFSMIPGLDVSAGWQMTDSWRFTVGYSLMYWTNVLRASEQIDTNIHESFFGAPTPTAATPNRPTPLFDESNYLAHGISIGFERRW